MLGRSIVGAIAAVLAATVSSLVTARAERETLPGIENTPFRIAAAKGYCEQHSLVCKPETIACRSCWRTETTS